MTRVLGISGSLRRDSHNRRLLRAAAALLPPGAELVEFDRLKEIPPFDEDDEPLVGQERFASVRALRDAIAQADAVLIATPEYNHSVPGQLKNAIDWASRPAREAALRGKPAAVVGASVGMFGAVWAQAEVRKALGAAGARVLDRELPVGHAHEAFTPDGLPAEPELEAELRSIAAELVEQVAPLRAAA
jgi:chromate reductase